MSFGSTVLEWKFNCRISRIFCDNWTLSIDIYRGIVLAPNPRFICFIGPWSAALIAWRLPSGGLPSVVAGGV
jgi:hypothetical protein